MVRFRARTRGARITSGNSEMGIAHDFLRLILPVEGYKCAMVVDGEKRWQKFFATTDELADFILRQDALGRTVYHACGAFETAANRKHENSAGARSYFLDVDAGPNKPYPNRAAAISALAAFCQVGALPTPLVVGSGAGLHIYWPLDKMLDPVRWEAGAKALKQLCDRHNFMVDRVRTADISSILRTPGTHNRKAGLARLVECGPLVGPYALSDISVLAVRELPGDWTPRSVVPQIRSSLTAAALNLYGVHPGSAWTVAEHCNQVGTCCDQPGTLSEPVIYAVCGVARHCHDVDEFVEWFDEEWRGAIQRKLEHHEQSSVGPTTCKWFESINPKGCEGCPYKGKITSPIQLGRSNRPTDTQSVETQPENQQEIGGPNSKVNGHAILETASEAGQAFIEVHGFVNDPIKGLYAQKEGNKGELIPVKISAFPIHLRSLQTNETDTTQHNLVFTHKLPRGDQQIVVSSGTLFSSHGVSELAKQGIMLHEPDQFRRYVRTVCDTWHTARRAVDMRYDQFGWKNNDTAFLCGNRLYSAGGFTTVTGSPELVYRSQYLGPRPGGSIERWSSAANQLFAGGLEVQSFGLLCGFAAPLMRFQSKTEGGAIASFVNADGGSGKTTTLEGAATIWGDLKGVKLYDDDTKVAKGLKLGIMGNLPCTYDELASRDPEIIRQFVLMFTNAEDRDRGRPDGTLVHNRAEWQTILLLASNKPIVDLLSSIPGQSDAHAYRLLEFTTELKEHTDKKRGDELRRQLEANAGWAGDAYLRLITQPGVLSYIKEAIPRTTDQVWERTGLDSQHRFWVRMIASCIIAGTVVRHYGMVEFSIQRIADWVMEYAKAAAIEQTGVKKRESEVLGEFMIRNLKNMLAVKHEWRPQTVTPPTLTPQQLFIRIEEENKRAFIVESELRKFLLENGIHRQQFNKRLQEMGVVLATNRYTTMGAGTAFTSGQVKAYVVDMAHPLMSGVLREVESVIKTSVSV